MVVLTERLWSTWIGLLGEWEWMAAGQVSQTSLPH
jgi:hypothetical protein